MERQNVAEKWEKFNSKHAEKKPPLKFGSRFLSVSYRLYEKKLILANENFQGFNKDLTMNKLYFIALFIGAIVAAWFMGKQIAGEQCNTKIAALGSNNYAKFIKIQEKENENVAHHPSDDIRRVLRQKYTIAD